MKTKKEPTPQDFIAKLVQERIDKHKVLEYQQPGEQPSPRIRRKRSKWDKLRNQPVYLLSMTVQVGAQSLLLEGLHLGINSQVMKLLEDAAKGGYRANISQKLKDAAHKLQARQKTIYSRYTVLSEPFRLVHEASLPEALKAIEEMQQEAEQLRLEIVDSYQEEYTAFLVWAHQVLTQANLEGAAIEAALTQYADAYPTQEDFQECLQVVVEGPVKIPSLIEDAQIQAEEARKQATEEAAKREREKLALLRRSQEALEQTLLSTLYDAQTRSRDEAYGKLASLLESFALSGEDATQRTGQKWTTLQNRLEVLAQYDPNLEPIVQRTGQIQSLLLSDNPNLNEVQTLMDDFRVMLKERVKKESNGAGVAQLAKALAFDAEYSDLLKQLDAIAEVPHPEKLRQLKGRLASMDTLLNIRSKSLREKLQLAENAVRQKIGAPPQAAKSMLDSSDDELEQPRKGRRKTLATEPYDPEAGF